MTRRKPARPTPEALLAYIDWQYTTHVAREAECSYTCTLADDNTKTILFSDGTTLVVEPTVSKSGNVENVFLKLCVKSNLRDVYAPDLSYMVNSGMAANYPTLLASYTVHVTDGHIGGACEFA